MGATSSHYDTTTASTHKSINSPFTDSTSHRHTRLISDINQPNPMSPTTQQRVLTLREYQILRATRSQSHNGTTSKQQQQADSVTRTVSAPCLSSRSSSSASNLSSASTSSSRHLSPRLQSRKYRYTSANVHPQFTCTNCNTTCNIVPYSTVPSPLLSAVNSSASTVSTDSTTDQSFCNRDCYYSYCFRLAEELDCPADDIIEGDYHSVNGYMISAQVDADVEDDTEHSYAEAASYQQQQPTRVLQISRVH